MMFGRRNDDKIIEHTEYVSNQFTPKHILDKAVREFEQGRLDHLRFSDDATTQSVMNELEVRANDNARNSKRR